MLAKSGSVRLRLQAAVCAGKGVGDETVAAYSRSRDRTPPPRSLQNHSSCSLSASAVRLFRRRRSVLVRPPGPLLQPHTIPGPGPGFLAFLPSCLAVLPPRRFPGASGPGRLASTTPSDARSSFAGLASPRVPRCLQISLLSLSSSLPLLLVSHAVFASPVFVRSPRHPRRPNSRPLIRDSTRTPLLNTNRDSIASSLRPHPAPPSVLDTHATKSPSRFNLLPT